MSISIQQLTSTITITSNDNVAKNSLSVLFGQLNSEQPKLCVCVCVCVCVNVREPTLGTRYCWSVLTSM